MYEGLTEAETAAGQAGKQGLFRKIKYNFDYLYGGVVEGRLLKNASFEIDSDADGIPDTWTRSLYPGGTGGFVTDQPAHGKQAYAFWHPGGAGNGGGSLHSDYIEVSQIIIYSLGFILWSSVAGIKNIVRVVFYTASKVELFYSDLYFSTNNPTSPTTFQFRFSPPANCRYIKIAIFGGVNDVNVAGWTCFDGLILEEPATRMFLVGDILIIPANTEKNTSSEVYIKMKEIILSNKGTLRIKFDMKNLDNFNAVFGRIYKNGAAVGTERLTSSSSYITYTEDIGSWNVNDLCQLYCRKTGLDNLCLIRNFQLFSDYTTQPQVMLD